MSKWSSGHSLCVDYTNGRIHPSQFHQSQQVVTFIRPMIWLHGHVVFNTVTDACVLRTDQNATRPGTLGTKSITMRCFYLKVCKFGISLILSAIARSDGEARE
jgi:hypothetical protein